MSGDWRDLPPSDPAGTLYVPSSFHRAHRRGMRGLHDWTAPTSNFDRFGTPPAAREGDAPASDFCRTTQGIRFYDSIVVFERRRRPEPWRDIR